MIRFQASGRRQAKYELRLVMLWLLDQVFTHGRRHLLIVCEDGRTIHRLMDEVAEALTPVLGPFAINHQEIVLGFRGGVQVWFRTGDAPEKLQGLVFDAAWLRAPWQFGQVLRTCDVVRETVERCRGEIIETEAI